MAKQRNIVFSTDPGWKKEQDSDKSTTSGNTKQGTVYLRRETKGRGGKTVTIVQGLAGDLKKWKKEIQKVCGAGGTIKNGAIEIQGEQRERIAQFLESKGIKFKISGG